MEIHPLVGLIRLGKKRVVVELVVGVLRHDIGKDSVHVTARLNHMGKSFGSVFLLLFGKAELCFGLLASCLSRWSSHNDAGLREPGALLEDAGNDIPDVASAETSRTTTTVSEIMDNVSLDPLPSQ